MNKDEIYKEVSKKIDNTMKYYLGMQDYIEELLVPKIDYTFLLINISMIYRMLGFSKNNLDSWYSEDSIVDIDILNKQVDEYKANYYRIDSKEEFSSSKLFYSLICIPNKIELGNDQYTNTLLIKELLDYIECTYKFVSEEDKEDEKTN